MFSIGKRQEQKIGEESTRQPLLNGEDHSDPILFSVDDEDEEETSVTRHTEEEVPQNRTRSVRFQEEVRVIGPPLRSTLASREAEFELDSDELDEDSLSQLHGGSLEANGSHGRDGDQSMPLLVGLVDRSAARQSLDLPLTENGIGSAEDGYTDLQELAAKRTAGGNMVDSVANMANSILGAGLIGLPYAISQAGFFTGLFLLVVLCGVTDWTIRLIVINAKLSGRNSYIEIMNHCFGASGRAAVSFFQFAFAFGGMCAFGIIIGDTIPHVIRSAFPKLHDIPVLSLLTNRQFVIGLCTLCISYPLSLYRDIHKLSRASGLALIGMLIIVTSVLIEGPHVDPRLKGDPSERFSFIRPGIFQAIGVISFAFVCHHNSLLIYGSLRTPTLDRFATVTHISTLISLLACCTLAISAFLVFTDKTQGNILNNFSPSDTLINVARFCFGLNMFTTLPLELFVCREVVEQFFFPHEAFNPQRHLLFTTSIIFSSMFISLITCDLGVMLEITGGISATVLAFIFPAACYVKLLPPELPLTSRAKLPAVVCVAFGAVVMLLSLILAMGKVWTVEGDAKICV
ncbi:amino acid transporter [Fomitiporia mediterranea MF3/22]|uniref:amino acid transporter n=1 Tax=Fomitiporia mediterranea (strain MF3/22) TaxID=694068 RepID=UPI0004407FAA|nr:amino acid transporter [Fomitiporia mediterranea MF3/22]EJD03370.1 amino acid transporter [Fomitiporia mediterranea MF3/22]